MKFRFKSIKYIANLLFITILVGCSEKDELIVIHPLESDNDSFSVRVINTIQLSSRSEALIGSIDKILLHNNNLYVLDKNISSLLIFKLDGNLIKRIPRGKGPGELVAVQNFTIINEQLVIAEPFEMKHYSLNGQFEYSIKLPKGWYVWSILGLENNKVLIYGSASLENSIHPSEFKKYHIVDDQFSQCFHSYYSINKDFTSYLENQPASYHNGSFLFSGRPYNYIYELDGNDFKKKYFVDFGDFNFTNSDIDKGYANFGTLYRNGQRYGLLDNIIENQFLIHFIYGAFIDGKGGAVPIIYSKENNKTARFNDILKDEGLPNMVVSHAIDEGFVCFFEPGGLNVDEIKKINSSGLFESTITSNSNPVLVIIEIIAS